MATQDTISHIVIAHSGLEKKVTKAECLKSLIEVDQKKVLFIDFEIANAKLSELYQLPFEQLALEQQRKFKGEVEPILAAHPDAVVAYFGLAPIPLAFQLGVLVGNTYKAEIFQSHHELKTWYRETDPIQGYSFEISPLELPQQTQKGKGDVFIRVSTSYRIEPQHTYGVLPNPTNEFDIALQHPHVDGISNQEQMNAIGRAFQDINFCLQ